MIILGVDPGRYTGVALFDTAAEKFVYTRTIMINYTDIETLQQYVQDMDEAVAQADIVVIEETILKGQRIGDGKCDQIVADIFARFVVNMFTLVKIFTVKPEAGMHPSLMNHPLVKDMKGDHVKSAARLALYGWEFLVNGTSAAKLKAK